MNFKNSNYKSLAVKHRPKILSDVKAQQHIIKIIKNSVKLSMIHSAYLLTGIQGVGKTTFARIMATLFNCTHKNILKTLEPCLICQNCLSINSGTQIDVIEIDAASNTGVSDVREIINKSRYKPINIKYKIFIIDEVHMLSNSAFNALLKILEETPFYTKFIFATTEIKKLPRTFLSRCQKLDLRRFHEFELEHYLYNICKKESVVIEHNAIKLIIKSSNGSARDALSLLDQAILTNNNNTYKHVYYSVVCEMFSIVQIEYTIKVFDYIIKGNVLKTLHLVKELYNMGIMINSLIEQLCDITYKITLYKINNSENTIIYDIEKRTYQLYAKKLSVITLTRMWQMLNNAKEKIHNSYNELITFEMCIIRIIYANFEISLEDILTNESYEF